ncbi:hypothetical protein Raf01_12780 [Rugosimonospora africana]|uniref:NERD domain-containing protein n=2 Tax=Rugosimonospora africana TaxID=556532 RepID=A0A8J3VP85_9ACTN|nr:hypothetical protein Raf01_12780 [Rugosimonospora africana]
MPTDRNNQNSLLQAPRPTPLEWARRRRNERDARRAEAVRERAVTRMSRLGVQWKVIDIAELGLPAKNTFLTIGPGGVFLVTVKEHGRTRVRLAGDVVQIDGRRLTYIPEARKLADQAGKAMSRTAGSMVPVTPVVALSGTGVIDVHGLPKGCVVTSYRELDYLLGAYGERIAPSTVSKLYSIARHPVTWATPEQRAQVESYKWYAGSTATDKTGSGR